MFKPNYQPTNVIINNIAAISQAREAILCSPILPKVENKLRQEALISRTHHSTSIEGNPLDLREVKIIAEGGKVAARPKDQQEIKNYLAALKYLEKVAGKPGLTASVALKIQQMITKNILPAGDCGKYRDRMVYVVNSFGQTVFTPPSARAVPDLVLDLINWLNHAAAKDLHPVLVAGIAHYELVRIHPFIDGNGRTARALATLILYQRNFDIKHFFALDDYYNEDRTAYYTALQYIDPVKMEITQWLEYFTEGVAVQMKKLKSRIDALLRDPILSRLKKRVILKDRQWKALEYLKEAGRVTNQEYQKITNTSRETAKRDLSFLVNAGVLRKQGKGRSIYYQL